ncbi:MAG: hypothetical protein R3B53_03330 [Candidatus Paceibacterota bacterium]
MPGSRDTSFIPKHTTGKTEKSKIPRQLFLGTILVRVLFFSVMIATAGVFFYERKLSQELAVEIGSFRDATKSFEADEEKLQTVLAMDKKLAQASDRFYNGISVASILKAIEVSTIATTRIENLDISRESDLELALEAKILTDSFDSVLFQRSILEQSETLKSVELEDVSISIASQPSGTPGAIVRSSGSKEVSFSMLVDLDPTSVPALTTAQSDESDEILIPVAPVNSEPVASEEASTEVTEPEANQNNI